MSNKKGRPLGSKNLTPEQREERRLAKANSSGRRGRQPIVENLSIGKVNVSGRPARVAQFANEVYVNGPVPHAIKRGTTDRFVGADGKEYVFAGYVVAPVVEVDTVATESDMSETEPVESAVA